MVTKGHGYLNKPAGIICRFVKVPMTFWVFKLHKDYDGPQLVAERTISLDEKLNGQF